MQSGNVYRTRAQAENQVETNTSSLLPARSVTLFLPDKLYVEMHATKPIFRSPVIDRLTIATGVNRTEDKNVIQIKSIVRYEDPILLDGDAVSKVLTKIGSQRVTDQIEHLISEAIRRLDASFHLFS